MSELKSKKTTLDKVSDDEIIEISLIDYIEHYLYIKFKDGDVGLFKLNKPQRKLYNLMKEMIDAGQPVRIIILKARQMGFSTLVEGIIFSMVTLNPNLKAGIITHRDDATTNLLNMFKFYFNHLPNELKPQTKATNTKEVIYDTAGGEGMNSLIKCMTATSNGVGRSDTFQLLHISEYAFWQCDKKATYSDLMQSVPATPNSMVFVESTANGFDDFKDLWDQTVNGENDFKYLFVGWNEMDEYRRPYYGFELTQEEKELMLQYDLDLDQITWRRWAIANNCQGDINKFHQEYPICPEEAFISSGDCMFDLNKLAERLKNLKEPIKRGYFKYDYVYDPIIKDMTIKNPKWIDDPRGEVFIYEDVKDFYPYVTGGDTAGEGSDANVFQVLDNTNGRQVCKYKTVKDSDIFTKMCMAICLYYNEALYNVETNFNAGVVAYVERMGYRKIYLRETYDQISKETKQSYGFRTTSITRPLILDRLIPLVRENIELINDRETIIEMQTFCLNASGKKYEAIKGKHDDHVMALAIAYESYSSMQHPHHIVYPNNKEKKGSWIKQAIEKQAKERKKHRSWY
ncbi:MAG TPA: hypothetical protein PKV66_00750 [Candidatus Pelethenecus sp.]|nr:hypothetical protein [Candidatus Pelethenecus sp.]